jgi:hypothetical protein
MCGGMKRCVGLGEVVQFVRNPGKKGSRPTAIGASQ